MLQLPSPDEGLVKPRKRFEICTHSLRRLCLCENTRSGHSSDVKAAIVGKYDYAHVILVKEIFIGNVLDKIVLFFMLFEVNKS